MSKRIVFITGSPSLTSRSSRVASAVAAHIEQAGFVPSFFSIHDFDPADVLLGRVSAPAVASFIDTVKASAGIVFSTPVYKATYAGGLKAVIDLVPPDALVGKAALGIATTRLAAHGAEVDRAYRALFAFFRAAPVESLVALDDELSVEAGVAMIEGAVAVRVASAAREFVREARREQVPSAEAP